MLREVESHPVALAQCERFFAGHPQIARKVADDTAGSVQAVINAGDRARAAIAGSEAAELYGGRSCWNISKIFATISRASPCCRPRWKYTPTTRPRRLR